MADKKIIFFDLDDTLLTIDKLVTDDNKKAIQEALAAGHFVTVTTGRSIAGGKMIADSIGLNQPGCFLLCFQGSMLYDLYENKLLMTNGIAYEDGIHLMKKLDEAGIFYMTYDKDQMYAPRECQELIDYNHVTHEKYHIFKDYTELQTVSMPKIIAIDYHNYEKLKDFQASFRPYEPGHFDSFFSCFEFLEYCNEGSNKGSGLIYLADYLHIPIDNTVAVGDERNDVSMIHAAGVGCAMCNGRKEAKDVADYITECDNNHSGVAEVIYKFLLN